MNDSNPLEINSPIITVLSRNRSGRPSKEDLIRFGPQPQSQVSKLLQLKEITNPKRIDSMNSTSQDLEILSDDENSSLAENKNTSINSDTQIKTRLEFKQYICDYPDCTYACQLSSNLTKHKRRHSQEKPYLCDKCTFQSKFVNSLKAHRRIHTNERPYKCSFCTYCCNSSSNLKKHCKHRHLNEPLGIYK